MQLNDIYSQFALCKNWEERYRLLIQFSCMLPKPSSEELEAWQEIHGCESRLWFEFSASPRNVQAYSDARLMQGMLLVLTVALQEKSADELADFSVQQLFDELHITRHLSSTRLNGLKQIEQFVRSSY